MTPILDWLRWSTLIEMGMIDTEEYIYINSNILGPTAGLCTAALKLVLDEAGKGWLKMRGDSPGNTSFPGILQSYKSAVLNLEN